MDGWKVNVASKFSVLCTEPQQVYHVLILAQQHQQEAAIFDSETEYLGGIVKNSRGKYEVVFEPHSGLSLEDYVKERAMNTIPNKVNECDGCATASAPAQPSPDSISVNTSFDSQTGEKTLSINARNAAAEELAQILQLSGITSQTQPSNLTPCGTCGTKYEGDSCPSCAPKSAVVVGESEEKQHLHYFEDGKCVDCGADEKEYAATNPRYSEYMNNRESKPKYMSIPVFVVHIPANIYAGKYYDYRIVPFMIAKSKSIASKEDAIQWVNSHQDEVLANVEKKRMRVGNAMPKKIRYVKSPVERNVFFKPTYHVTETTVSTQKPEEYIREFREIPMELDDQEAERNSMYCDRCGGYHGGECPPEQRDDLCRSCGENETENGNDYCTSCHELGHDETCVDCGQPRYVGEHLGADEEKRCADCYKYAHSEDEFRTQEPDDFEEMNRNEASDYMNESSEENFNSLAGGSTDCEGCGVLLDPNGNFSPENVLHGKRHCDMCVNEIQSGRRKMCELCHENEVGDGAKFCSACNSGEDFFESKLTEGKLRDMYTAFKKYCSDVFPTLLRPSDDFIEALSKLNPEHFTAEEIGKLLHTGTKIAQVVIDTGVRQGEFIKQQDASGVYYMLHPSKKTVSEGLTPKRENTGTNGAPKTWQNEPNEQMASWRALVDDSQGLSKPQDMFTTAKGNDNPMKVAANKKDEKLHENAEVNGIAEKLQAKFKSLTESEDEGECEDCGVAIESGKTLCAHCKKNSNKSPKFKKKAVSESLNKSKAKKLQDMLDNLEAKVSKLGAPPSINTRISQRFEKFEALIAELKAAIEKIRAEEEGSEEESEPKEEKSEKKSDKKPFEKKSEDKEESDGEESEEKSEDSESEESEPKEKKSEKKEEKSEDSTPKVDGIGKGIYESEGSKMETLRQIIIEGMGE